MKDETIRKKTRNLLNQNRRAVLAEILENGFQWFPEIELNRDYFLKHDDCDGEDQGIQISFANDGDAHMELPFPFDLNFSKSESFKSYRFRTFFGGTMSPHMNNALKILVLAIIEDSLSYTLNEKGEKSK